MGLTFGSRQGVSWFDPAKMISRHHPQGRSCPSPFPHRPGRAPVKSTALDIGSKAFAAVGGFSSNVCASGMRSQYAMSEWWFLPEVPDARMQRAFEGVCIWLVPSSHVRLCGSNPTSLPPSPRRSLSFSFTFPSLQRHMPLQSEPETF